MTLGHNPTCDALTLMRSFPPPDEASIINILANRTSDHRQGIISFGRGALHRDLIAVLEEQNIEPAFKIVLRAVLTPTAVLLAYHLFDAIQWPGTNETTLVEILCTRNDMEIQQINSAYNQIYERPLQHDLGAATSGPFRRLLVSIINNVEKNYNLSLTMILANKLHQADESLDEAEFSRIFSSHSFTVLRAVLEEYKKIKGKSLHDAIRSEFSGDIKTGLLAVVMCIENRHQFFAKCLHDAMRGLGTKDDTLIRIIVTRAEIDLGNIKHEYQRVFGRTLESDIRGDTSGDYKRMLLAIVQG
ncbi:annexin-B12-like [Hyalella azteca]|uniref:Annexin n=1 Tax=Hyalella azteca TaxID=294128 RepID=A0A8B7NFG7_HYAAZ|nr:annexin-B12-like [Hyalella azteca]